MSESNAMSRAMSLCDRQVTLDIDGREFVLRQLPRLPLQQIIELLYSDEPVSEKKGKKERSTTEIMFGEWERNLPILVRMLGFTPEKDKTAFDEVCVYLDEHLSPMAAVRLFETWYELNELDDFFARAGKVLLDPRLAARLKEERVAALTQGVQEALSTLKTEAEAS